MAQTKSNIGYVSQDTWIARKLRICSLWTQQMTRTPDIVRVEINHLRQLLNNATEKNKEYENKIAELEAKLDVYHKNLEHEYRKQNV